jgi:bifunctional non-homologous end joining protein LigD
VDLPYERRRELLEALGLDSPHWRTPPYRRGGGAAELAESKRRGDEGIMAKRLTARYEPGRRSRDWIKVKNVRTQEVVVGGWSPGQGARTGTIGSLLVGIPDGGGLSYVGRVGTGFTAQVLDELKRTLSRLERGRSPFSGDVPRAEARDAHWVTPTLVGEVAFGEWTRDGKLRQPRWRGERPDKSPDEVVRESR